MSVFPLVLWAFVVWAYVRAPPRAGASISGKSGGGKLQSQQGAGNGKCMK